MSESEDVQRYIANRQKEIDRAITWMTGKGIWFSGTRQVLVGIAAAAMTYGIGKLIGVSVG